MTRLVMGPWLACPASTSITDLLSSPVLLSMMSEKSCNPRNIINHLYSSTWTQVVSCVIGHPTYNLKEPSSNAQTYSHGVREMVSEMRGLSLSICNCEPCRSREEKEGKCLQLCISIIYNDNMTLNSGYMTFIMNFNQLYWSDYLHFMSHGPDE